MSIELQNLKYKEIEPLPVCVSRLISSRREDRSFWTPRALPEPRRKLQKNKSQIKKSYNSKNKEDNQSYGREAGREVEEEEINWSSSWCWEVRTRVLGFGEANRKRYEVVQRETRGRRKIKIKTKCK